MAPPHLPSRLVPVIGYAGERGEWPAALRLVEAIEPVLALAGHWEAWREVLEPGLEAAQTVGNATPAVRCR